MLSDRVRCINYLSPRNESIESSRKDFLPFIHERDFQGNLIRDQPPTKRKTKQASLKRAENPNSLAHCLSIFDFLSQPDSMNMDISTKMKTETSGQPTTQRNEIREDVLKQHFQIHQDGRYLNEHLTKRIVHKRMQNLVSYKSIQRQSQVPPSLAYMPNYDFNKKRPANVFISKTKFTREAMPKLKSCSQPTIRERLEEEQQEAKKRGNQAEQALNRLMKQINQEYRRDSDKYKNPLDKLIVDISQFENRINQTYLKSNVSKEKLLTRYKKL